MPESSGAEEIIPGLTEVQFACRRLLDCLAETGLWQEAKDSGIPLQLSQTADKRFYNFRQQFFSRKKNRGVDSFNKYGGLPNLYHHGKADGWKSMMQYLLDSKVATKIEKDGKTFAMLVFTPHGAEALGIWQVSKRADELYTATPALRD